MDPFTYELFIRKVYGYKNRTHTNGADASVFNLLQMYESDVKSTKYLHQLSEVKGYIFDAIKELQKKINQEANFDKLEDKLNEVLHCKTSECLGLIIDDCRKICKEDGLLW